MSGKICSCCGQTKHITQFNKRKLSKDGLQARCIECMKVYLKTYNPDYFKTRRAGDQTKTGSRLYAIHRGMLSRCYDRSNIAYKSYGGRGVIICDQWHTFEGFCKDMHDTYQIGLSIERIDVNGNYCPDNCIWIEKSKQARNKRNTIYITQPNGKKVSLIKLSERLGVPYEFLKGRYGTYGDSYQEVTQERLINESVNITNDIRKYIYDNLTEPTRKLIDAIQKMYPDLGVRERYIIQLKSDYKTGRKQFTERENP